MGTEESRPSLQCAERLVADELATVRAERDGFAQFRDRMAELDPSGDGAWLGGGGTATRVLTAENPIVSEYRRTVMDLPHYERDYGEPPLESIRIELGPTVETLVKDRSPMGCPAAVSAAAAAVERRGEFLELLAAEKECVKQLRRARTSIEARLEDLSAAAASSNVEELFRVLEEVDRIRGECESLLSDRQACLEDHRVFRSNGVEQSGQFLEYVYEPLPVDYPCLAAIAALVERLSDLRDDARSALIDAMR